MLSDKYKYKYKDKYQVLSDQQGGGGVVEVGCAPRGRPVSLGPYDNLVQVAVTYFDQSNLNQTSNRRPSSS